MQDQNLSPLRAFFRNKWVIVTLIVDAIVIIALIIIAVINSTKKSVLTFNVVPADAQILVNGREGYTNGSYRLPPNEYEIQISYPNLVTKTFIIDLAKHDVGTITTFLSGEDNDLSFYKLKDHYGDFLDLTQIASANDNQTTDKDTSAGEFIKKINAALQPYYRSLPIEHQEYETLDGEKELSMDITIKADHDEECETFLCLKALMVFTDDTDFVNSLLEENGFNLEDYEIHYKIY